MGRNLYGIVPINIAIDDGTGQDFESWCFELLKIVKSGKIPFFNIKINNTDVEFKGFASIGINHANDDETGNYPFYYIDLGGGDGQNQQEKLFIYINYDNEIFDVYLSEI